jgi:hypothetical protein
MRPILLATSATWCYGLADYGSADAPSIPGMNTIDDEAALLADIRFALRGLDPWPPKGNAKPSEDYARKVLAHLKLCGWDITRPLPKAMHQIR